MISHRFQLCAAIFGICLAISFAPSHVLAQDAAAASTNLTSPTDTSSPPVISEADKMWHKVARASQPPPPPESWATNRPSEEEQKAYFLSKLTNAADMARDFYTRYPQHSNAPVARRIEFHLLDMAALHFDYTNENARLEALRTARAKDDNLSEDEKFELRMDAVKKQIDGLPDTKDELIKSLRGVQKDFPGHDEGYTIMLQLTTMMDADSAEPLLKELVDGPESFDIKEQAKVMLHNLPITKLVEGLPDTRDELEKKARELIKDSPNSMGYDLLFMVLEESKGEKAKSLASELLQGPVPDAIKSQVQGYLRGLDAVGKPMDIQFTAIDGREVDLAKLKGKVVLVDFWATWCGPCMAELPAVKAAYAKLHDQGFEIVGISLDEDRKALEKTLKQKDMTWPQYFDGQKWENKYTKQYGIMAIPAMWLVDKNGIVRDTFARANLEDEVSKLLAEKQ